MKVISVANQKGGTGKSTAVQELATIFSNGIDGGEKRRVLVIDLDQQCNTTKNAKANKSLPNIFDLFTSDAPDIDKAIQASPSGYDIIAGSTDMSKADKQFTDSPDFELLSDLAEAVENRYDYIFIDNGPARNVLLNMNYLAADYMILCIDAGEDSIDGVDAIIKDMMRYHKGKDRSKTKIIGAIMSKYKRSNIGEAIVEITNNLFEKEEIPKILQTEEKPFVMTVRNTVKVDEAKMMRKSIQEYAKYSDVAMDYRLISRELRRRLEA